MHEPFFHLPIADIRISPYKVEPIEGFEFHINKETGEKYPNCCEIHKIAVRKLDEWFEGLPNCCDGHKEMFKKHKFNPNDFIGLQYKILSQLDYTLHTIRERINIENGFADIKDYIEYNVLSFGQPPLGADKYLDGVKTSIRDEKLGIPIEKQNEINEYIDSNFTKTNTDNSTPKSSPIDLNLLYKTYQNWINIFPFEISFLNPLKDRLENKLPIVSEIISTNRYTGLTTVEMHTKESLLTYLLKLTNDIITNINTYKLYKADKLTEPQKIKLELIIETRKMELESNRYLLKTKSDNDLFRKVLYRWLKDEKKFINGLISVEKTQPPKAEKTKTEILNEKLGKYGFLDLPMVKSLNPEKQKQLINLIGFNNVPYQVAMFEYLDFFSYLNKNHFSSKFKTDREVAKFLNSDERSIKGNINTLNPKSKENKERYTAHLHTETVKIDYEKLN